MPVDTLYFRFLLVFLFAFAETNSFQIGFQHQKGNKEMNGTRKRNGEGSVFQISDNKWVAKISLGTRPDGKPNIKQFSGKTEAIVKKKLKDFKKSTDFAEKHMPSHDTVRAYFTMWLHDYQYNKLKPSSYDRLESTVVNHIFPNIGGLKIDKVTRDQIQALINQLYKKEKLSYSSVKKVYVALNSCYKHAWSADVVIKNPCLGIVLPSPTERTKQIVPFATEEIGRLKAEISKAASNGAPLYCYGHAFLLILHTGLRMGEALSLCWEDIDFDKKTITVSKNNVLTKKRDLDGNKTGGYELQTQNSTKSSSGNRVIPINRSAEEALLALKHGNTTPYVIINNRQHQVLPSNFERSFRAILKNAGIDGNYGVHALRHTFASMLFAKGIDVKIVSNLLGHSTVKITYDTYVHLFEKDISHVTSVLD
jgi:integrase